MVSKLLKFSGLILLMTTLTGCPGEENCDDYGATTRVDNLITITPLKSSYNKGEKITYKIIVPSKNSFFGREINLFESTKDNNARLLTSDTTIFVGNDLNFVMGTQDQHANWFNVPFNSVTNNYELEMIITLNKSGQYIHNTNDYISFQGTSECNRYRLDTSIMGSSNYEIKFTVE